MDTVTYPKDGLADFIEQYVVPLRVSYDHKPLAADFGVTWTPTIIMLDQSGKEHHRTVGFLDPEELKASVLLGKAKVNFDGGKFEDALLFLGKLIDGYPRSSFTPEAIFMRGVSQYKHTHNPQPLKEAYQQLTERFPGSEWTKRAQPYRLL
jgi:hypothetical protein